MTSTQQHGIYHDRVTNIPGINLAHLECPICKYVLWKPVACQSCETPFCSSCIDQSLAKNSKKCPQRCEPYKERRCPPFIAGLLSELQIDCFYKSTGCQQVVSYEALDKHEIECDYQTQQCLGCQSQILKKDFDHHNKNCASIELICEDCKRVYKRGETATKHTEVICLNEQIRQVREELKRNKAETHAEKMRLEEEFEKNKSEMHAKNVRLEKELRQIKEDFEKNKSETHAEIEDLKAKLQQLTEEIKALNLQLCQLRISRRARITFDDLPNAIETCEIISNAYQRLKWTNFSYANELYFKKTLPKSGYVTAFNTECSPRIAFFSKTASIERERSNETFTFVSITAGAAWYDDLELIITGYRNSTQTNTQTATLLFGQPQSILLQWEDIDRITFEPSGGTQHPGAGSVGGKNVVLTELTIDVPNAN